MFRGNLKQQLSVQRLDPAHVDHRRAQCLSCHQRRVQQCAKSQDGNVLARPLQLRLAERQGLQATVHRHTSTSAPWIAHSHRVILLKRTRQQLATLVLIGRAGKADVRNAAQEGDVIGTGVRRPVSTDQTCSVEGKHHWQILQCHVVNQLVIGPLQESRIDRDDRLEPLTGQTRRKSHCMLLGDSNIKIAPGKALFKLNHAGPLPHGRCNAHQSRIAHCHVAQPVTEDLGKGQLRRCTGLLQTDRRVKLARAVIGHRIGFSQLVALPLFRHHMQELRSLEVFDVFERRNQGVKVMAIDGADVIETEFFEQGGRHHHAFGVFLYAFGQFEQRRGPFQNSLAGVLGCSVKLPAQEFGQIAIECAHRWTDAHVVVVQDHQQIGISHASVVQRFKSHARSQRTIADHGDHMTLFALDLCCQCHPQCCRNGGAGMRRPEIIVFTFRSLREPAQAAELAQRTHAIAAAGQNLVRVGLMTDVPNHTIIRGIENVVQRHGKLNGT